MTFREFWESRVDASPDREFLVYGEKRFSFDQVDREANRVAAGLQANGIGAGDRVGLLLPSDLALLHIELAIHKVGAVMVPMIYGLTGPEVAYVIGHAEPDMCITDAQSLRGLGDELPGVGRTRWLVFGLGEDAARASRVTQAEALYTDIEARPGPAGITPSDPMAIMYTSGSTGKPKGVVQPTRGLVAAAVVIADRLGATEEDNFYSCLPLFHAAATHMLLAPAVACGGRFTLVPSFSRDAFWGQVRESGSTITLLMPAQLAILMTLDPSEHERDHGLRQIFSHVQPADFIERFGCHVSTAWAMTETSGVGIMSHPGQAVPNGSIGVPVVGSEAKILGAESGQTLSPGEQGELWFRHSDVMLEYFKDPENTAATLVDGWVRTGDLCSMDVDGNVYFHGRIKNVIKRAGENIAGEEVEFCIIEHPEVVDCVTVAVPDPIYTEEVHAIVGVRAGSTLTPDELTTWVRTHLSDWKVPRYLTLREGELARLPNGKLDRLRIRADHDVAQAVDCGSRAKSRTGSGAGESNQDNAEAASVVTTLLDGSTLWLCLNRPDALGAISYQVIAELQAGLDLAESHADVRAVVLTSTGPAFSAGADLKAVNETESSNDFRSTFGKLLDRMVASEKPVIAAVNGLAMAGGLELILACDVVFAAESARIGDGHSKYGLLPGGGGAVRLPRLVGRNRALEMLYSGELYPAELLCQWGLVNRVLPDAELLVETGRFAAGLGSRSPLGLARMKRLVNETSDQPISTALSLELLYSMLHEKSHDMNEGVAAFVEKRDPRFTGR
ncbi:AMP-binding protein [Nocardioides sp. CN2-186]|uniref:AMP-binding protein n=1 Tax=Nocardioides tweenelious TaxID=3156607 RepID=UPI0032B61901